MYTNREISWLDFNKRVLEQANDPATPLLERLRFLCISSTNLDEFFEIRVASLKQKVMGGLGAMDLDGRSPQDTLKHICKLAHDLVDKQYEVLNSALLPQLAHQGVLIVPPEAWTEQQRQWVSQYFQNEVLPVLSPIGLDPAHPFPRLLNKSLNLIVSLQGKDAFGRDVNYAIVPAPRSLPRIIPFPRALGKNPNEFVSLATIIMEHLHELFSDMQVVHAFQFRVTRNSNLFVDEEEVDDLLMALEGELPSRRYGDAVRLEIEHTCPHEMTEFLLDHFNLDPEDLYLVDPPVNLNRLLALYDLVDRADLKFGPFSPSTPRMLAQSTDFFEAIRKEDILLLHPFESFAPILDFVRQASRDPNVLVIRQTLYRTGLQSVLADYLVEAAASGKEVTVIIELRARFDEETNISIANRLQEAGAHVVYGVVGYKTHAKMLMVVRREGKELKRYVHLGTGNYHARTTRQYTDYGFFTSDPDIGEDVNKLFLQLTGLGKASSLKKLLQSPFSLQKALVDMIARESENARQGKVAWIRAKVNSVADPQLILALYDASKAGVKIDLLVRGICCIRPGVPDLSENISVRSVVGRFLEHARVYYFHNDGDPQVYLSSADFMTRNLMQRVEVAFPILNPILKQRVIRESLDLYWADNLQSWELDASGEYRKRVIGDELPFSAQGRLLQELTLDRSDAQSIIPLS